MRNKVKEEKKASEISTIVNANMGKRLLTAIIDALFFGFIALICTFWVFRPIVNAGLHFEDASNDLIHYRVASHLYVFEQADDAGNYYIIEVKDFTEKIDTARSSRIETLYELESPTYSYLIEHTYYYYHSYLTNVDVELPNNTAEKTYDAVVDKFASPNYDKLVNNVLPADYYTDAWILENVFGFKDGDSSYFIYDESKENFVDRLSLKEGIDETAMIQFLRKASYDATAHLNYSDYFVKGNNIIKWARVAYVFPSIILSYSIFYILIPLLFKNGETLAKKYFKIAVISSDNFQVKRRQVLFRELLMFMVLFIAAFAFGIGFISLAMVGAVIVLLLIGTLISKDNRSLFDYAAMTKIVDSPKSIWFESYDDEVRYAKELDEKMAKYKNKKIINKNVIQIGTTIVNEDVKKEFEESKKDSSK